MKLLTQWAVTSSALILIVLAVRFLLKDRLSARLRYALWGLVLLRLLVPFQIELPAPVSDSLPVLASNLAPRLENAELYAFRTGSQVLPEDSMRGMREFGLDTGSVVSYEGTSRTIGGLEVEYRHHYAVLTETGFDTYLLSLPQLLTALWAAGAGLAALVILASNLRFGLGLRKRRKELEFAGGQCPPLQGVPVYVAGGLPSPCLFGVFRPAVYLTPEAAENPDTLRHVLAHELTHYKHKDHIWSALRCLALALHWYNPLAWLAVGLSKQDGELACDEGAVQRLGEDERIPYGRTLVDMVAARSLRPGDLLSCSTAMTGGESSIKRRVAQLVKKPETAKAALFAVIAVAALSAVFVFAGRAEHELGATDTFLAQVQEAQAIGIGNPMISSLLEPGDISDPEALAQAKELLSKNSPVAYLEDAGWNVLSLDSNHPPEYITQEELERQFLIGGHPLNLFPTASRDIETAHRYWLVRTEDDTLLVQWFPEREENTVEILAALPMNTINKLKELARTNGTSRPEEPDPATPATYDYNRYRAQLEAAQGIWLSMPMLHDGRVVTGSAQLEQLRGLLALEPLTEEEASRTWAGARDTTISFTSTPPDADWSGSGDCVYYVSVEDGGIYIVLPDFNYMSTITGAYLGRIPDGNWEKAEEILKSAPSVDDRQHAQRALLGDLTQEQVDQANKAFEPFVELSDKVYGTSEISCFFTSSYDDPTQINLEDFLRYCPIGVSNYLGEDDTEEFLAVMAKDNSWFDPDRELTSPLDLPVPVHRYPRAEVSALLQKYADVTVEELDWTGCLYVEEYDAFYNFTSDAGPGFFPCAGGQFTQDGVLLWSEPDETGDRCELKLRKSGDRWLIQSHHTTYER